MHILNSSTKTRCLPDTAVADLLVRITHVSKPPWHLSQRCTWRHTSHYTVRLSHHTRTPHIAPRHLLELPAGTSPPDVDALCEAINGSPGQACTARFYIVFQGVAAQV